MEYAQWLEPLAIQFLENWRTLNDGPQIKDLVLATLRSLNSRHRAYTISETETQDEFSDKKSDWSLSAPIKFSQIGQQE
jgi:hypothetical protein